MLDAYAQPVVHVGRVGQGQVVKLLYNLLFIANADLVDRVTSLAVELGTARDAAVEVLDQLRTSTFATGLAARSLRVEALDHAGSILATDVGHALDLFAELRLEPLGMLATSGLDTFRRLAGDDRTGP